jgi:hypothetical protein
MVSLAGCGDRFFRMAQRLVGMALIPKDDAQRNVARHAPVDAKASGCGAVAFGTAKRKCLFKVPARRTTYGDVNEYLPQFKQLLAESGRDPATVPITLFGGTEDVDLLKRYRDMRVERVVTTLPPEPADKTLPALDRWAKLIRSVNA